MIGNMLQDHWFWGVMTIAVLVWYSTVTIYVGIKGAADIKHMFRDLDARQTADRERPPPPV